MRTFLDLDQEALEAAKEVGAGKTKTAAINEARRDYARRRRLRRLLKFEGKSDWKGDVGTLRRQRRSGR